MTYLKLKSKYQSFINSKTKQEMMNVYYIRKLYRKNRISRISYSRKTKPISRIFDKILKDRHFSDKGFPTKKYLKCKNFSLEFWKYIIKRYFFTRFLTKVLLKQEKSKCRTQRNSILVLYKDNNFLRQIQCFKIIDDAFEQSHFTYW